VPQLNSTAMLLVPSICRPFIRARRYGRGFPGLKPWAEPCSPPGQENLQTKGSQLPVQEFLSPGYVCFFQVLNDDRDVWMFLGQPFEVVIIV
jgi:hypothetical protein